MSLRTGPSTDYEKVGSLSTNEAVTVTGVADTGWYRLDYKDTEVYVSNKYVQDTKVVSTASTSTASTTSTSTDSTSTDSTTSASTNESPVFDDSDIPWVRPISDEEWAARMASGAPVYTSGGGSGSNSGSGSVQESQFMESMAREAFDIVNQYRANIGLDALTWNDAIYEGTKIRAQELVTSYSHTRPNGESCFTVISDVPWTGENIYAGPTSASQACTGWYNSEGHRNNMLNENCTKGAIACWYENGTYYWVNLFAM
ncbi:MAG: SH3 domain-containing protein [Lachnospiraceae bacterium]|nr:SH3 domain-containing protein [Lachnospiraceae bacterium]